MQVASCACRSLCVTGKRLYRAGRLLFLHAGNYAGHASCYVVHAGRYVVRASNYVVRASCYVVCAGGYMMHAGRFAEIPLIISRFSGEIWLILPANNL